MKYLRKSLTAGLLLLTLLATMTVAHAAPPLESADPHDIIRVLKLLRDPRCSGAVPLILPLLHHKSGNVIRDTCRTLAVIANKDVIPSIEPLLKDSRPDVRKDAQDAIDQLRADHLPVVNNNTNAPPLLATANPDHIVTVLKLLRSPECSPAVPVILPLLNHKNSHVVRDTCRTLAVIGNKDVIPSIQPLVDSPDKEIRKDAQDAIAALKAKP